MERQTLDAESFKKALIAGSHYVINEREHLNAINVFPVADSDTGNNMADTMQSVMTSLDEMKEGTLSDVTKKAAEAALMGARGNSGIILAQFIHGLAEELAKDIQITAESFSQAARKAVADTYATIMNPREGTILSVMKEWAHSFAEWAHLDDITAVQKEAVSRAKIALEKTKEQLQELKRADVVDAGAKGFVRLMEGFYEFLRTGLLPERSDYVPTIETPDGDFNPDEPLTYRFCTECLVSGSHMDLDLLRNNLSSMGDSLIVAGSQTTARLHIHTDNPAAVFNYAATHGDLSEQKIDDMLMQYRAAHDKSRKCLVVVDSGADVPNHVAEELHMPVVPLNVTFKNRSYIDRLGLSNNQFYRMMAQEPEIVPTTSQPSSGTFKRLFANLLPYYEQIIYIGLSSQLSGTIRSAENARTLVESEKIHIVDSKNLSVGNGLIAKTVAQAAAQGADFETCKTLAENLVQRTRFYAVVPNLIGLIQSGRVSAKVGRILKFLGLRPILTVSPEGTAAKGGVFRASQGSVETLYKLMKKKLSKATPVSMAVGHVDSPEEAKELARLLSSHFSLHGDIMVSEISAALSAHGRRGVLGVAYIEPEK